MPEFNEHIRDWHKAIESEFQALQQDDPQAIAEVQRKRILAHTLELTDNLIQIAKFSENDNVRLNTTKYLQELAFPATHSQQDDIAQLLNELTANTDTTA